MPDLLQTGSSWLTDRLHDHVARDVIYARGGQEVGLKATIGATTYDQVDEFGAVIQVRTRDYLIRGDDLVLDAGLTVPQPGDQIRELIGSDELIHEVLAPPGQQCYRPSDAYRYMLRIHTRQVNTRT